MSPPALVKMEDTNPEVLASKNSNSESRDSDPIQARFNDLCKSSDCYVFRKWGRVGNDKIGGNKLEEMSKSDAICEFKRLFLEKTGNSWEAWEQKQNFQKQPGRFFPLDIDYGVNKQVSKKNQNSAASKLAPPLAELMKMLFNVETYRAAMMEFEINMSEMPLGKLSKSNIQKGFEALTEIQNLLNLEAILG